MTARDEAVWSRSLYGWRPLDVDGSPDEDPRPREAPDA